MFNGGGGRGRGRGEDDFFRRAGKEFMGLSTKNLKCTR